MRLDKLEVRARWTLVSTITTLVQDAEVPPPPGQAPIARPQKFWGAMQSQGAPSVQGDAFLTRYETRAQGGGGTLQTANPLNDPDARYDPDRYYDYAIEIPGGSGTVLIFDPGFCDASGEGGTGERWNVSGTGDTNPTGNPTRRPISSFFDLWDTRSTLLDTDDDLLVASTGSAFRRQAYEDHTVLHELDRQNDGNATDDFDYSQTDCSTQPGHFGWYRSPRDCRPARTDCTRRQRTRRRHSTRTTRRASTPSPSTPPRRSARRASTASGPWRRTSACRAGRGRASTSRRSTRSTPARR